MVGTSDFDVPSALKERAMDEAPVGITISDPERPDNPLVYINDAFERITGYPKSEILGNNCRMLQGPASDPEAVAAMRRAIDTEEPVTVELLNFRKDGSEFWNEVTIAPLRNEAGNVTNFVGFQSDVTARKEAELAVERERANLEHLVDRINGLLQDVTETLMQAVSRAETERAICDRIVESDPFVIAAFAEPDLTEDVLTVTTSAGPERTIAHETPIDDDGPTAAAYRTGSIQTASDLGQTGDAIAAIPLTYGETTYGVLTVIADQQDAFDENELVVLEALGRAIATAINAAESRRILVADNYVELEFAVSDRAFFPVDLSARLECHFEFHGSVGRTAGNLSMFLSTDADHERLGEAVNTVADIRRIHHVSGDGESSLFEFEVEPGSLIASLAERGVKTRSIAVENGVGRLTLELPPEIDARGIVRRLQDRYPGSDLVAYRERERPPITKEEFIRELEDRLTDRQLTALHTAYVSGYYDANRRTSGDELAESMDISRATFHQHLRAAERKLVAEFLD